MIQSFLVLSFRNLFRKNRTFTIVNIAGLSVGIASLLLVALFIYHEYSFDRYHRTLTGYTEHRSARESWIIFQFWYRNHCCHLSGSVGFWSAIYRKACRQVLQEDTAVPWYVCAGHCFAWNAGREFILMVYCVVIFTLALVLPLFIPLSLQPSRTTPILINGRKALAYVACGGILVMQSERYCLA